MFLQRNGQNTWHFLTTSTDGILLMLLAVSKIVELSLGKNEVFCQLPVFGSQIR